MKKWLTYVSLGVILFSCVFAAVTMSGMERSYEGAHAPVPVHELQKNPESYDDSFASGAADAIVQQNLAETHAVNDVTSIVFDFRGYDTMGEAFILVTAVTGSAVILFKKKAGKEEENNE
jgi:hypothetical protein